LENQEKFEIMMNTHNNKISELNTKVEHRTKEVDLDESKKGKGVTKEKGGKNEFYYVNIYNIIFNVLQCIFMPFLILIIT
jgi:hypothetical protein